MAINFMGLDRLDTREIELVKDLSGKSFSKISRSFPNAILTMKIEQFNKGGKKSRFDINLKLNDVSLPSGFLSVNHSGQDTWDLTVSIRKAFGNLQNELEHKIKPQNKEKKKIFK
ncbi:hypothetical protein J4468_03475 [Candidatus Woesearchaeota archaeon]|nr:hypothetical protein [Candidatus Woesearchaeota archaeon]